MGSSNSKEVLAHPIGKPPPEATCSGISAARAKTHNLEKEKDMVVPSTHRKRRPVFTKEQVERLQEEFNQSDELTYSRMKMIARATGLTTAQVHVWFQNRRQKEKRISRRNVKLLEEEFSRSIDLDSSRLREIAGSLNLTKLQVVRWFSKRLDQQMRRKMNLLEEEFANSIFLTPLRLREIAEGLELTETQVEEWFLNRRKRL